MKRILATIFFAGLNLIVYCQQIGWYHKDLEKDTVFGVSTEKAYQELLRNKRPQKVIVGIIDSGIDTAHEDLRPVLWTEEKTGIHGWNYIGRETGKEDITELVGDRKDFYDSLSFTVVPEIYRAGFQQHRALAPTLSQKKQAMQVFIENLEEVKSWTVELEKKLNKTDLIVDDFRNYKPSQENEKIWVSLIIERFKMYKNWEELKFTEIDNLIEKAQYHLLHGLNISNGELDTTTGDSNINPDALGLVSPVNPTPLHGTHVAGIIGAKRNNGVGLEGIADNVQLMMLKANGNIRELRDKSLAKGIRFAVDHGATIINLSFGKPYTWDKKSVDEAIAYGRKKNVLFIHAAGNAAENLDVLPHYPSPKEKDNWIEVGASGLVDDKTLPARFSNYGKKSVDVFAPGVQIYSSIPGSKYEFESGTSMAAPVVTGIATLIKEYYPSLSAVQIKEIILKTVIKRDVLSDKCISGGVVNAYNALQLAATYKKDILVKGKRTLR